MFWMMGITTNDDAPRGAFEGGGINTIAQIPAKSMPSLIEECGSPPIYPRIVYLAQ